MQQSNLCTNFVTNLKSKLAFDKIKFFEDSGGLVSVVPLWRGEVCGEIGSRWRRSPTGGQSPWIGGSSCNDIQHFPNINKQGGWDFESGTMEDLSTKRFVCDVTYMSSFSAGCMKSYHWDPICHWWLLVASVSERNMSFNWLIWCRPFHYGNCLVFYSNPI